MSNIILERLFGLFFAALAVIAGLSIFFLGEIGSAQGTNTVIVFDGLERLFGIVPIAVGLFIAAGVYHEWK